MRNIKFTIFLLAVGLVFNGCNRHVQNYLTEKNLIKLENLGVENAWEIYEGNPVIVGDSGMWDGGALGSMSVLIVKDTMHLYYESWGVRGEGWTHSDYASLQIGHATSVDGISWTKDSQNPVIPKGKEGEFDEMGTWDPFVLYEDGIYKMWYGGGVKPNEIGYATSKNGSHFTKQKQLSNDLRAVEDMHVVHDETAKKYYMYYWHRAAKSGKNLVRVESENETNFNFKNPVNIKIEGEIYPGRYKFTHVFLEDSKWYIFYSNFTPGIGCVDSTIRFATSDDGINWQLVNNYILDGMDAEVLKISKDLYLMYYGPQGFFDRSNCDIRLAMYKGKLTDMSIRTDLVVLNSKQQEVLYNELAKKDLKKYIEKNELDSIQKERLFLILKERSKAMNTISTTLNGEEQKIAMQKVKKEFEPKIEDCIIKK